ncbi:MAG: hypothetical protein J6P20_01730 [Oscillospiraceae bacterium]|nr:hypothetical protein [Oscillospiraceae bacterium]
MTGGDHLEQTELSRDEYTDWIYETVCFTEQPHTDDAEELLEGIARAAELENKPFFLEGLSERLTELGVPCTPADTEIMLTEVKRRYKALLHKACPRTVQEWVRGTTPGVTNRLNNYELCCALELDYQQTAVFFQKHFLTLPYHVKCRTDAVFLYCLYHKRPYETAAEMLEEAKGCVPQENAHTATAQIISVIQQTDDDAQFMRYLSAHCYGNAQQFQLARSIINEEIGLVKESILADGAAVINSPERMNSLTVSALLGYKYQSRGKNDAGRRLPKRFTESLPNDVTLGRIINGDTVSYELLRKTLMLLRFYNFYNEAENTDRNVIAQNLLDFYEGLNATLISCGFAQIYIRHPFDCLLLYCANSYDPIVTLYSLNELHWN